MMQEKAVPQVLDRAQAIAIDQIIKKFPAGDTRLIEILLNVQEVVPGKFISQETAAYVAEALDVRLTKIYDVITFYGALHTDPRAKFNIEVCESIVCKINNNAFLIETLTELLGIKVGEMTPDKKFSLSYSQCIGQCDMAPALRVNQKVYTKLDSQEKIRQMLKELEG